MASSIGTERLAEAQFVVEGPQVLDEAALEVLAGLLIDLIESETDCGRRQDCRGSDE